MAAPGALRWKQAHVASLTSELSDGLGAFADGVLGEFPGENEPDGGLHFATGERPLFAVAHELGAFQTHLFENIVDERVHDVH